MMEKYLWTKNKTMELIEMLQDAPALWDIGIKENRDRNLKFDEMTKMANHFTTNVDEISRKIKSLKTQFSREKKKIVENSKSGAGTISEENIWFGYIPMKFIIEKNTSLGSRSTIIEEKATVHLNDDDDVQSVSFHEGFEEQEITLSQAVLADVTPNNKFLKPSNLSSAPIKSGKRKTTNDDKVDEAYKFMCSVQETMKSKDDFAVYGENVASRMRLANKNPMAVAVAKNYIDNILFKLEMDQFYVRTTENDARPPSRQHKSYSSQSSPSPSLQLSSSSSASVNSLYSNPQNQSVQSSPPQYTILEVVHENANPQNQSIQSPSPQYSTILEVPQEKLQLVSRYQN